MGSFVALHVEMATPEKLLRAVGEWLRPYGFGEAESFDVVPKPLQTVRLGSADAVGCASLNADWHILLVNSFFLSRKMLDAASVRPFASTCGSRSVFVSAQTTGGVYQLAVFDGGDVTRLVTYSDHQGVANVGTPLPGERPGSFSAPANPDDDPPSFLDDATTLCASLGFDLWSTPPLRAPGHYWRKRGLLARVFGE